MFSFIVPQGFYYSTSCYFRQSAVPLDSWAPSQSWRGWCGRRHGTDSGLQSGEVTSTDLGARGRRLRRRRDEGNGRWRCSGTATVEKLCKRRAGQRRSRCLRSMCCGMLYHRNWTLTNQVKLAKIYPIDSGHSWQSSCLQNPRFMVHHLFAHWI